jgi:Tfp pilus assembly protein PilF
VSLISESLKRVADQRAGHKQPPVIPRRLAGQRPANKKRLLMLLALIALLAGIVIGVVVYGMILSKGGKNAAEEAQTPVPQRVIFEKIHPPRELSKSDAGAELQQAQEPKEDERTPVKPKVVQVAIEEQAVSPEEAVNKRTPLQPRNKVKVGVVSLHSAAQVKGEKEPLRPEKMGQPKVHRAEESKPEHLAAPESTKKLKTITISEGAQPNSGRSRKSGQVNLYAESTAGASSLYRKAVGYQKTMKWQKAIETYNKVLKYDPMSAEIYNNIGVCYEKEGQLKMAAKYYEKAISINPRFYPSYNNLGIIYYRLRDFVKARAAYEQALQLNPGNSQSEVNLALVYERLRRGELARRTLERVLINDPENPEAHYNLARMLEEQGQQEEALTHYRQFLAANPSAYPQLREKVEVRVRTLEGSTNQ